VALALLAELLVLGALALAPPSAAIGIPAAVAAAIAGTVAVVYGIGEGVGVAAAGAIAFGLMDGWGAGEIASVGVWPAIVAAAGLFARRVDRQRSVLRRLASMQEEERRELALALHDRSAQTLAAALYSLRAGESNGAGAEQARALIHEAIEELRRLAVDLSPKVLEDYGLGAALERLAEIVSVRGGIPVEFRGDWDGRLSDEAERALFRFAQGTLSGAIEREPRAIGVSLGSERGAVLVTVSALGCEAGLLQPAVDRNGDHVRALDGRVSLTSNGRGDVVVRAELPTEPHAQRGGRVA
jgi:signal transduction histidine kinase